MRLILKLINKFSKCISCFLRALMVHEGLGANLVIKIISQKKKYKVCKKYVTTILQIFFLVFCSHTKSLSTQIIHTQL